MNLNGPQGINLHACTGHESEDERQVLSDRCLWPKSYRICFSKCHMTKLSHDSLKLLQHLPKKETSMFSSQHIYIYIYIHTHTHMCLCVYLFVWNCTNLFSVFFPWYVSVCMTGHIHTQIAKNSIVLYTSIWLEETTDDRIEFNFVYFK